MPNVHFAVDYMNHFVKRVLFVVFCFWPLTALALSEQQQQFVHKLQHNIQLADQSILKQRDRLMAIHDQYQISKKMPYQYYEYLFGLGRYYKVKQCKPFDWYPGRCVNELLNRVDILPTNLIIAQAINESNWGRSRFATQANNYFGIWCFTKGCGLVPKSRAADKTFEVESFATIKENVAAYYRNINTHNAYQKLRQLRAHMRQQKQALDAMQLATGLDQYSARKQAYVKSIQRLIQTLQQHQL